jgi:surface antigen
LGGIAGNAIARDACKNDRADAYYYNNTYYGAFDKPEYGRRYDWRNPHNGNYGYITPIGPSDGGRYGYRGECREFRQTVYINGQQTEAVNVACRTDDGHWKIVGN